MASQCSIVPSLYAIPGGKSPVHSRLTALLSQYPQIKLAIWFGSRAAGNARPDSDTDLGIRAQAPLIADFKLQLI
ncbi:MAG: nucleotidyltransferase domain-containing protein [Nitrosomonas sp.]|nr:MAG: nucleotidyltransferase domain-containing protein [Nitrosomonas sp.]